MLRKQILLLEKKKLLLPEVKQIFASRTQMLLSNHMFPSLATRTHCFILTEACSCRLELAYFTGKKMVCKNAVAFAYYGSGRLLVMGSCEVLKPRPKDRNISQHCWAQHVACVWPPCCDALQHVGCCWPDFDRFQI